jgi:Lar family restriction alleviation protein
MKKILLPCPFCGDNPIITEIEPHKHITALADFMPDYDGGAFIECLKCSAMMSAKDKNEALSKWNRRTSFLKYKEEIRMNNVKKINMKNEKIREGQPRPYADSEYEFIIKADGMTEFEIKKYCMAILEPCSQTYEEWMKDKNNSADVYFRGYYEFEKLSDGRYRYYVLSPYCD